MPFKNTKINYYVGFIEGKRCPITALASATLSIEIYQCYRE
jgi:hypothetical protein